MIMKIFKLTSLSPIFIAYQNHYEILNPLSNNLTHQSPFHFYIIYEILPLVNYLKIVTNLMSEV